MNSLKNIFALSAVILFFTIVVELVASIFLPSMSQVFWVAPLYFWVLYAVAALIFKNVGNMLHHFLLFKGVKMFITMVVIFVLAFLLRSHTKELIIYFLIYYMLFLVVESVFVLYIRKNKS